MQQYKIQKGDTLYSIAKRFRTTVQYLATVNKIANANLIRIGQVILVPGGSSSSGSGSTKPPIIMTQGTPGSSFTRLPDGSYSDMPVRMVSVPGKTKMPAWVLPVAGVAGLGLVFYMMRKGNKGR